MTKLNQIGKKQQKSKPHIKLDISSKFTLSFPVAFITILKHTNKCVILEKVLTEFFVINFIVELI